LNPEEPRVNKVIKTSSIEVFDARPDSICFCFFLVLPWSEEAKAEGKAKKTGVRF